jgi:hypothetical protein
MAPKKQDKALYDALIQAANKLFAALPGSEGIDINLNKEKNREVRISYPSRKVHVTFDQDGEQIG